MCSINTNTHNFTGAEHPPPLPQLVLFRLCKLKIARNVQKQALMAGKYIFLPARYEDIDICVFFILRFSIKKKVERPLEKWKSAPIVPPLLYSQGIVPKQVGFSATRA